MRRPFERLQRLGLAAEILRNTVADIGEAHRIELVQRPELALRIPPLGGHGGKPVDFGLVDGAAGLFGHGWNSLDHTPCEVGRSAVNVKGWQCRAGEGLIWSAFEGERRHLVPGWGDLRHMQVIMVFAVATPTRDCVATSPSRGGGAPLLPIGEKRECRGAFMPYSHARKIRRGFV